MKKMYTKINLVVAFIGSVLINIYIMNKVKGTLIDFFIMSLLTFCFVFFILQLIDFIVEKIANKSLKGQLK